MANTEREHRRPELWETCKYVALAQRVYQDRVEDHVALLADQRWLRAYDARLEEVRRGS